MEREQTPKQVQPEDTKGISIEERDAKREFTIQPRIDDTQVHPGSEWVLQPVRGGEWLNVVDREKCSAVGEGYPQETRLQAPKRLC